MLGCCWLVRRLVRRLVFMLLFMPCFMMIMTAPLSVAQAQADAPKEDKAKQDTRPVNDDTPANSGKGAATKNSVAIPAPLALEAMHNLDMTHYLSAEQITPLVAGDNDFITLVKESTTANSKGVAILLADWQQTAITPKGLNYLRNTMPGQGWTTLSIQPPAKPKNYPSIALTLAAREQENLETLSAYQLKLSAIMKTVMLTAKNYPGIFVVIVAGSHSAILTDLYQKNKNTGPGALIILSGYMANKAANDKFASALAQTPFPVLDLYLMRDHPLALSSAKQRLSAATKAMKAYYRQRQLTNRASSYYPQKALLRAIKGWLTTIGW